MSRRRSGRRVKRLKHAGVYLFRHLLARGKRKRHAPKGAGEGGGEAKLCVQEASVPACAWVCV